MKKNLLFTLLLLTLPSEMYSAGATQGNFLSTFPNDPYAHSQMITVVQENRKAGICYRLADIQESIEEFFEAEEKSQQRQKQCLQLQKKEVRNFFLKKAQQQLFNPQEKITLPCRRKSAVMPLLTELLKKKLYQERSATRAKITEIFNFYDQTKQLIIPLEIFSEALDDKDFLEVILKEEADFCAAVRANQLAAASSN